jgi:hypothetical protein
MHIIPSTWTELQLLQQFFPIFTALGADIFVRLMTGWVLCTRRRTVTGMLPFADPPGVRAHDAYHRFLPDGRWDLTRLRLILARLLIQTCGPKGSFADAMACLRRRLWRERIKLMFGNLVVHDKKFRFLLETLAPAA